VRGSGVRRDLRILAPEENLVGKNAWKTQAAALKSLERATHESFHIHRPLLRLRRVQPRHQAGGLPLSVARTHQLTVIGNAVSPLDPQVIANLALS
jgi:hypothetical protein